MIQPHFDIANCVEEATAKLKEANTVEPGQLIVRFDFENVKAAGRHLSEKCFA